MHSFARRVICAALCGAVALSASSVRASSGVPGSPKLINLFLNWQIRDEDLPRLARWDVVVLDADQQARYPDKVRQLRALHPSIKILAYIPSEEIAEARFAEPPEYPLGKLARQIQDAWYLRSPDGQRVYFWPGSAMLNVTNQGPTGAEGERWNSFFPRFVHNEVLSSGLWDGVFLDNTFDGISHFAKSSVDLDRNGTAESAAQADAAWRDGMRTLLRRMHELNPDAIIVGNGGAYYGNQLHGAFFEHFPSWNWSANWSEFRSVMSKNLRPSFTALNVNTDNVDRPTAYSLMRFGLASAVIGGGYYSFDRGDRGHEVTWWYDEYEVPLGEPRAEPRLMTSSKSSTAVPGVWGRDFQHGLAIVNSTDKPQSLRLSGVYELVKGSQDPIRNSGALVSTIDLSSRDGVILLRRLDATEILQSAFLNGSFIRPYDAQGASLQNGFFAQRTDAANGILTLMADVDRDGGTDLFTVDRGLLSRRSSSGQSFSWNPFGARYRGGINMAVGQANRDSALEVIIGREGAAPPEVRVFSSNGTVRAAWNAYTPAFAGGVRVAIGDLDGDGLREIVTGAGPGGGPHIRLWKTDGAVWGGGFFAFDPTDTGGVSVAVGDVDGDRKDEIVVASGQGAIPRVRIFDGRGGLKSQFSVGAKPLPGGLRVITQDVNGDGKSEILVSGVSSF